MKILKSIFFALAAVLMSSCITNDGNIGIWYGVWAVDRIDIDGTTDTTWEEPGWETAISFQSDIVYVTKSNSLGDIISSYGSWSEDGDRLSFNFTHHDDESGPDEWPYLAPTWIYFAPDAVTVCTVTQRSSKNVVLEHVNDEGQHIVYHLKKVH